MFKDRFFEMKFVGILKKTLVNIFELAFYLSGQTLRKLGVHTLVLVGGTGRPRCPAPA